MCYKASIADRDESTQIRIHAVKRLSNPFTIRALVGERPGCHSRGSQGVGLSLHSILNHWRAVEAISPVTRSRTQIPE
jgi:hypothetical protein